MANLLRSDLPWQAEYISANVSRFYKIKTPLCSRFCFIFALWVYFSFWIYLKLVFFLLLSVEVNILFENGNICRDYIVVYLF